MTTTAVQLTRTAELVLATDPDTAFGLFEPVGEARWASGWAPRFIHPPDGTARAGTVFVRDTGQPSFWLIAEHDRELRRIVYAVFVPDVRVTRLEICCAPNEQGTTRASVVYAHTSLGERGDDYLARFTAEHYAQEMRAWQRAIDAYLDGKPLAHH